MDHAEEVRCDRAIRRVRCDNGLVNRIASRRVARVETPLERDPDTIARYLDDAAHYPGGHAPGVFRPQSIEAVASILSIGTQVLPVGAQSSLTGGATPMGEAVLSTERLSSIRRAGDVVVAGAGVTLHALQAALAEDERWFPPVPTYLGATVGGAIATCAAGAATFKYGTVRPWVEALTVVIPGGEVLEIARGEVRANDGVFVVITADGERRLVLPAIAMPAVPKHSAGYFVAPAMDLVDLFIGAEGTLGVVVEARLRTAARPAGTCWLLTQVTSEASAITLTDALRRAARQTWSSGDPRGLDIAAIEHIDRRSLDVVRDDGVDRRLGLQIHPETAVVLLAQIEVATAVDEVLWEDVASALAPTAADRPLTRLARLLDAHGVLDRSEIALPGNRARAAAFVELREAVPAGVNRRVALAKARDGRIHKTAADVIVPDERFAEMLCDCRRLSAAHGLDVAVWGHISDGNVHPNVIPQCYEDVERGRAMLLELARCVIALGGCPLAEHGVGRHSMKQHLLELLYSRAGVDGMRQLKRSMDPAQQLAPGVLFPR